MINVTLTEWERLLAEGIQNCDLCYLAAHTSRCHEAWRQLLKQGPSPGDIKYIMSSNFLLHDEIMDWIEKWSHWSQENDLYLFFEHACEMKYRGIILRDRIGSLMLKKPCTNSQLVKIIIFTNLSHLALDILFKQNPSNSDLINILIRSTLQEEVWEELSKRRIKNDDLLEIIRHTNFRQEAYGKVLEYNTNTPSMYINFAEIALKDYLANTKDMSIMKQIRNREPINTYEFDDTL